MQLNMLPGNLLRTIITAVLHEFPETLNNLSLMKKNNRMKQLQSGFFID